MQYARACVCVCACACVHTHTPLPTRKMPLERFTSVWGDELPSRKGAGWPRTGRDDSSQAHFSGPFAFGATCDQNHVVTGPGSKVEPPQPRSLPFPPQSHAVPPVGHPGGPCVCTAGRNAGRNVQGPCIRAPRAPPPANRAPSLPAGEERRSGCVWSCGAARAAGECRLYLLRGGAASSAEGGSVAPLGWAAGPAGHRVEA